MEKLEQYELFWSSWMENKSNHFGEKIRQKNV